MFTAALFTTAKIWKQPQCVSTDEWVKKMQHINIMEYYSAVKKNENFPYVTKWMDLESIMLSEVSQRKTNTVFSLTCGIQKIKQ